MYSGSRAAAIAFFAPILCLLLVVASVVVGGVVATGAGDPGPADQTRQEGPQNGSLVLENTTIVVEPQPEGDARWIVEWTFSVPDGGEARFRTLADEFERGASSLRTPGTLRNVSQQLDSELDRPIRITEESRGSSPAEAVRNGTGQLRLSFTWENFARVDGDRLHVDDTLVTEEHGVWLPVLTEEQSLIVRVPPRHGVIDANVDVQNGALRWEGPTTFDASSLQTTFIGDRGTPVTPSDPGGGNGTGNGSGSDGDDSGLLVWGIVGSVLVVVAVVLAYFGGRHSEEIRSLLPIGSRDDPSGAGGSPDPPPEGAAGAATGGVTEPDSGGSTGIDEELLSDEERVERLLEANGGRMKQSDIVDETGWSNAKVSQLLSSMADEGRIDKLRIGRENLISFPDVDVTGIESDK